MPILNSKPLRVVPDPYHALDHNGFPCGVSRLDPAPEISAGQRIYIGAELADVNVIATRSAAERAAGMRPTVEEHRFRFNTSAPTDIDDTSFHRNLLRQGSILPWDEATHRRIFGATKFVDPKRAIAASRARAIEAWKGDHDGEEPAFVEEERAAAEQVEDHVEQPVVEAKPTPQPAADGPALPHHAGAANLDVGER